MKGNETVVYDERFRKGYRARLTGYEKARWQALAHFLKKVAQPKAVETVLDYGSGSGLFLELWHELFPGARIHCTDISPVALEQLQQKYSHYNVACGLVENDKAPFSDGFFDLVVSVEVMEHAGNLDKYLEDIQRLLKPGGTFAWTTPCANRLSIEHIYSLLSGKIEKTSEGFRRWRWEEQTHLRRLRGKEIEEKLLSLGFARVGFRFRAHLFSFVCTYIFMPLARGRLAGLWEKLMLLDYLLFRRLPNGASMIGYARKKASGSKA